jgi:hypothetical protein
MSKWRRWCRRPGIHPSSRSLMPRGTLVDHSAGRQPTRWPRGLAEGWDRTPQVCAVHNVACSVWCVENSVLLTNHLPNVAAAAAITSLLSHVSPLAPYPIVAMKNMRAFVPADDQRVQVVDPLTNYAVSPPPSDEWSICRDDEVRQRSICHKLLCCHRHCHRHHRSLSYAHSLSEGVGASADDAAREQLANAGTRWRYLRRGTGEGFEGPRQIEC